MDIGTVIRALRPANDVPSSLPEFSRTRAVDLLGPGPVAWAAEAAVSTAAMMADFNQRDLLFPVADSVHASETALLTLLTNLGGGTIDLLAAAPIDGLTRDQVRRQIPVEQLIATLRLAQHHWLNLLVGHTAALGAPSELQWEIAEAVVLLFDQWVDQQYQRYVAERERFVLSDDARRRRVVEALIAAEPVDDQEVRDLLRLHPDDQHIAYVITPVDSLVGARDAADRLAAAIGPGRSTRSVVHPTEQGLWVWASGPRAAGSAAVDRLTDGGRLRVGIGSGHAGLAGFRRTHAEAMDAHRMTGRAGQQNVARYRDVALAALLSADPERAGWFVQNELGQLAGADLAMAELRDTLWAYFESGQRLVVAAAQIPVHRNTLLHRLNRIEKLIGHPVTARVAELQCALLLADTLGGTVLR